ncbi:hypothetical protein CNEO4_830018 [Clostridium neonatale]|nr:hypothetical protein CNEO4_830018 [Clostridium neonatale]
MQIRLPKNSLICFFSYKADFIKKIKCINLYVFYKKMRFLRNLEKFKKSLEI